MALWLARISSIRRARRSAVLPLAIKLSTSRLMRAATCAGRKAEIARPHQLALAHRNAADDLGEIFAERDAHEVFLDLAERAGAGHAFGIGGELAHRLDIGGEPGQPVGGALLAIEQAADRLACHHHPLAHLGHGIGQQGIEGGGRLAAEFDQVGFGGGAGGGDGHGILGTGDVCVPAARQTLRVQCTKAK